MERDDARTAIGLLGRESEGPRRQPDRPIAKAHGHQI
jgi:hypothetical protein